MQCNVKKGRTKPHQQGIIIASIFWGLWLFPLGRLIVRSGFVPRALGVLMIVAGVGYLASSLTSLLLPRYADLVGQFTMVLAFGELPFIVWLLIWGVKLRPSVAPAAESAGSQSALPAGVDRAAP